MSAGQVRVAGEKIQCEEGRGEVSHSSAHFRRRLSFVDSSASSVTSSKFGSIFGRSSGFKSIFASRAS